MNVMKRVQIMSGVFICVFLLAGLAFSQQNAPEEADITKTISFVLTEKKNELNKIYQDTYNLILDEKWQQALTAFDNMIAKYPSHPRLVDARFWQCYAREKLGSSLEKALESYRDFVESYPNSRWMNDARTSMILLSRQLVKEGKSQYEDLIRSMEKDEEEDIILTAITALGTMGDDQSLTVLKNIMKKEYSPEVRLKILYVLASFNSPEAADILIDIARNDETPEIRGHAVMSLGTMLNTILISSNFFGVYSGSYFGDPRQTGRLLRIIESTPDGESKQTLDTEKIVSVIAQIASEDPERSVRLKALSTLQWIPGDRSVTALIYIAKNCSDYAVRKQAILALGQCKDPRAREALLEIIAESGE